MSLNYARLFTAASLWLVVFTPRYSPAMADPNDLFAPVFVNRPQGTLYFSHCDTARYTFQAVSAATGLPSPFVRYRLVSGPGSIDSVTGEWKNPPTMDPSQFGTYSLEIAAREFDLETEGLQDCFAQIQLENRYPSIYAYIQSPTPKVAVGDTLRIEFREYEPDQCDSVTFYFDGATPDFAGDVWITRGEYLDTLSIAPRLSDSGKLIDFTIVATDGFDSYRATIRVQVLPTPYHVVRVATIHNQPQGEFVDVPVYLDRSIPSVGVGGFDLVFAYDNSGLAFQAVSADSSGLYHQCQWEYFTYRYGVTGNCNGGCPPGLVRVVGIAETNNGTHHPICPPDNLPLLPVEMFRIQFWLSYNPIFDCAFVPIRFFFVDCSDNSLSSADGRRLYVIDSVFEFSAASSEYTNITHANPFLPTYIGLPSSCLVNTSKGSMERGMRLYGGGIQVFCNDTGGSTTDVIEENSTLPLEFALHQNYPNPFNPSTTILFDLPHAADVDIEILNILGQVVWSQSERMAAGTQVVTWDGVRSDGSPVSSGVYYYRLTADDLSATKKMVLMK